MNAFPIRNVLSRELFEMLILLGTSGSAGHCVEVRLLSLMHAALVCYRSDPLLTLSQSLIELSQPLKSCGISLAQLLHMDGIGRPVSKRGKLGDGSLNQLIIVVAKGSLMTFNSLEVRNPLALGSDLRPLYLLRRWLGLLLWLRLLLLWLFGRLLCLLLAALPPAAPARPRRPVPAILAAVPQRAVRANPLTCWPLL